jgi:hypothetical protein
VIRIALAGGPDSGKTALARSVAAQLRTAGHLTEAVAEYARDFISRYGVPVTVFEGLALAEAQQERERVVVQATAYLVTDSPLFLSYIYSAGIVNLSSAKERGCLSYIYRGATRALMTYDHIFFLPLNPHPRPDGVRTEYHLQEASAIGDAILAFLKLHRVKYSTLPDPLLERRTDSVLEACLSTVEIRGQPDPQPQFARGHTRPPHVPWQKLG